jgi:hypothetical protein
MTSLSFLPGDQLMFLLEWPSSAEQQQQQQQQGVMPAAVCPSNPDIPMSNGTSTEILPYGINTVQALDPEVIVNEISKTVSSRVSGAAACGSCARQQTHATLANAASCACLLLLNLGWHITCLRQHTRAGPVHLAPHVAGPGMLDTAVYTAAQQHQRC